MISNKRGSSGSWIITHTYTYIYVYKHTRAQFTHPGTAVQQYGKFKNYQLKLFTKNFKFTKEIISRGHNNAPPALGEEPELL